jgi:hypothetical protein
MPGARRLAAFGATAALLAALACAGIFGAEPTPPPGFHTNLLVNPGFEAGTEGWSYPVESPYWGSFEVVESPVHSGRRAAHLRLRADREDRTSAVHILGVMQELRPERFPDVVGGYYRVEGWEKGADVTDLYLQMVAIVWTDEASAVVNPGGPKSALNNYQLRFYLAGVSEPPFLVGNAKLLFVTKQQPEPGRWTYFEIPLRQRFEEQWGRVPSNYDRLRLLFEARWDNRPAGSKIAADAYLDDLFAGYVDEVR